MIEERIREEAGKFDDLINACFEGMMKAAEEQNFIEMMANAHQYDEYHKQMYIAGKSEEVLAAYAELYKVVLDDALQTIDGDTNG